MMRLTPLDRDQLTEAQQAVLDAIESGPRGKARAGIGTIGPFSAMVKAPGVGDAIQTLGGAVRFGTSLPENIKEVAICTVGVHFRARFEFSAHKALAKRAGVSESALDQLARGEDPEFSGNELLAHAIASQLLNQKGILDETYNHGVETFGEEGMIELVATAGYYCLICMILNGFKVPLEDGMEDPFPDDD